jgi:UDPglucose 6-dehydrogenase
VGLVQAAILAHLGHDVLCVDSNPERVTALRRGDCPIHEPGLPNLLKEGRDTDHLFFGNTVEQAVAWGEIIFVCVGTPPNPDGSPDLQHIDHVAKEIGEAIREPRIIVNKSTVPPGTAKRVKSIIQKHQKSLVNFDVVSNPEFLREGSAVEDSLHGDRIVIGADNWHATDKMMQLYQGLQVRIVCTDPPSAEMIKYASNAFLASKISFINAIAQICEGVGADVTEVARGMGLDQRIGDKFLNAGLGWGGSCFGKDTSALIHVADQIGYDFAMLKATQAINEEMPRAFVAKVRDSLGGLQDRIIAVMGLAFKPDTDDMRDARSIPIIQQLVEEGAIVRAYDPVAAQNARGVLPPIEWPATIDQLVECADAILIVTEWNEFKQFNWKDIQDKMRSPRIFDGRNLFDAYEMRQLGYEYHSIGR